MAPYANHGAPGASGALLAFHLLGAVGVDLIGDVAQDGDEVRDPSALVAHRVMPLFAPEQRAVGAVVAQGHADRVPLADRLARVANGLLVGVVAQQEPELAPQGGLRLVAGEPLEPRFDVNQRRADPAQIADDEDLPRQDLGEGLDDADEVDVLRREAGPHPLPELGELRTLPLLAGGSTGVLRSSALGVGHGRWACGDHDRSMSRSEGSPSLVP